MVRDHKGCKGKAGARIQSKNGYGEMYAVQWWCR